MLNWPRQSVGLSNSQEGMIRKTPVGEKAQGAASLAPAERI